MLAQALDMRIATGENLNTKYAFADLIARRGADIVQPDNRRAGGVSEWMEIAAIADGYGVEVASHGGGATNLNMLLAMPNAIYMETGGPVKMIDGEVPQISGLSPKLSYLSGLKLLDPVGLLQLVQKQCWQQVISDRLGLAITVVNHQFRQHFGDFLSNQADLDRFLTGRVRLLVLERNWSQVVKALADGTHRSDVFLVSPRRRNHP